MAKPPASPPSKTKDADRHRDDGSTGANGVSADAIEHAKKEGKGRPPSSRS